jgi:hypothetical protein
VVERFHWQIEASVEQTAAALAHLDPVRRTVEALTALGVHARGLSPPAIVRTDGAATCGLVIGLADTPPGARTGSNEVDGFALPGHIELVWSVAITPDGEGGCFVSIVQSAGATDPASAARLRDSWALLGPLAEHQTRRVLDELAQLAEDDAADWPRPEPGDSQQRLR